MKKLGLLVALMVSVNFVTAQVMDTITFPLDRASQPVIFGVQGGGGWITGTNSFDVQGQTIGTFQVGNHYDFGQGKILGAYVWFGSKQQIGQADSYEARVYDAGSDSLPTGQPLDQVSFTTADVDTPTQIQSLADVNYFDFPNDPQQTGRFVISIEVDGANQNDTLGVLSNSDGDGQGEERSVQQLSIQGGTWLKVANIWGTQSSSLDIDLLIFPVVEREFFADVTADKSEVCPGGSVNLNADVTGGSGNFDYQWTPGGSTPNNPSTTVSIGNQPINTTKTYELRVIDNDNQDTTTKSVSVDVRGIDVSLPNDTAIGCNDSLSVVAQSTGYTTGASFSWSDGTTGSTNTLKDGNFSVTVDNDAGCSANTSIDISVAGVNQTLDFSLPQTICVDSAVQFTNNSTFTSGWNFEWDFGGGSVSPKINPSFTYTTPGSKSVTLSGDSAGCKLSGVTKTFTVQDSSNCPYYQTGIADRDDLQGEVAIYPNPASDQIFMRLKNFKADGDVTLQIINIQGETLYTSSLGRVNGNVEKRIDMSGFSNGIYLIKLQQGTSFATEKVTLNR